MSLPHPNPNPNRIPNSHPNPAPPSQTSSAGPLPAENLQFEISNPAPTQRESPIVASDQLAIGNPQSQIQSPDLSSLSPRQQSAFHLLTSGMKPTHVALQVQVNRKTLARWLSGNVHFIAALNAWKHQTRQLAQARTLSMSDLALDALESALKSGDPKLALQIADRLGLFDHKPPGPQTPADVARQRARKSLKKQIKIAQNARALKQAAFPHFSSTDTVYSIDDRIWLLMLERKKALKLESPQTRKEREETQSEEAEDDPELTRIHQAIRYATEHTPDPPDLPT